MGKCSYKNLKVWKKAHELALEVYRLTGKFPPSEAYRLTHQLCRAAASIPTNIAEAEGRYARGDQIQFLHIARGSLFETQYLITLSAGLGLIRNETAFRLDEGYAEAARMLNGLIRAKRATA